MQDRDHTPRWITLDGAVNVRAVVSGVLLRGDNLQSLSAGDIRLLIEDEALEVVLDLRTDLEVEREGPGPLSAEGAVRIEHRSLYLDSGGARDLGAGTAPPWRREEDNGGEGESRTVRAYLRYLERRPDSIVGSVRTIARADGAVLAHCAAGKDRTGVIVAIALDAAGADRDLIVADYLATAERMEAIVARLSASPIYRPGLQGNGVGALAPAPGTIERLFELVDERFGGTVAWLAEHGLQDADLDRLRRRLAPAVRGLG